MRGPGRVETAAGNFPPITALPGGDGPSACHAFEGCPLRLPIKLLAILPLSGQFMA